MCGGTEAAAAGMELTDGLSPRVRGNLSRVRARGIKCRSIPACAGEPNVID